MRWLPSTIPHCSREYQRERDEPLRNEEQIVNEESSIRTEYGVRQTWPDGHVEVDRRRERADMETFARNARDRHAHGESEAVAEAVQRGVSTGVWTPIADLMTQVPPAGTSGTRIQWGVRRTWPDGHVEVRSAHDRLDAETTAEEAEEKYVENWTAGKTAVAAEAVGLLVLTGEWMPVPTSTPTAATAGEKERAQIAARVLFGAPGFEARP
jgi:hypothetical protein